jgi:uncharacterized protein (TIGR03084 family)
MPDLSALCADLAAEQAALDALVAPLDERQWDLPTPAEGWSVRDTIAHLANGDESGRRTVVDPDAFQAARAISRDVRERAYLARARAMPGAAVLAWWRASRTALVETYSRLDAAARITWYGPSMSARSFVTARLMEAWAHGQDVADALAVTRPASARLRHVAHLGVIARGWSYTTRGLTPPTAEVRVELSGPQGEQWTWGEADAADRVRGTALDFCLVVTRRRHAADTALQTEGPLAAEWMAIAQAFAGPPGPTRPRGPWRPPVPPDAPR